MGMNDMMGVASSVSNATRPSTNKSNDVGLQTIIDKYTNMLRNGTITGDEAIVAKKKLDILNGHSISYRCSDENVTEDEIFDKVIIIGTSVYSKKLIEAYRRETRENNLDMPRNPVWEELFFDTKCKDYDEHMNKWREFVNHELNGYYSGMKYNKLYTYKYWYPWDGVEVKTTVDTKISVYNS